ncbi:MAG TPA: hypothetical protein VK671_07160 [Mucilaginibacter sp.]|nr:hypothetical protein [Mucilaginibacter sp.]
MVVCLLGIVLLKIPAVDRVLSPYKPEFWFESATLLAFGFSWLVKGETIWKD